MTDLKPLMICADDFAQDEETNEAVLSLVSRRRLSAVSCFTDSPLWPDSGRALVSVSNRILLGLHFNLSLPFGFGEKPLAIWIARALARRIDRAAIYTALRRQIESFAAVTGRLPDYIDGHEHVHAFPMVRDVVSRVAAELGASHPVRIRDLSTFRGATDARLKRAAIRFMALARHSIPDDWRLNTALAGDYSLSSDAEYAELFASWLAALPAGGLIMCHPRRAAGGRGATAGNEEFRFLSSSRLDALLSRSACRLFEQADLPPSAAQDAAASL